MLKIYKKACSETKNVKSKVHIVLFNIKKWKLFRYKENKRSASCYIQECTGILKNTIAFKRLNLYEYAFYQNYQHLKK